MNGFCCWLGLIGGVVALTGCMRPRPMVVELGGASETGIWLLKTGDEVDTMALHRALSSHLAAIDAALSTDEGSAISLYNQAQPGEIVPVAPELIAALFASEALFAKTGAAVDINQATRKEQPIFEAGSDQLVKQEGVHLDLSEIRTGYAVDAMVALAREFDLENFFVGMGDDRFGEGTAPYEEGWVTTIGEGVKASDILTLKSQAIAHSHPKDGKTEIQGTVSVVGPSALKASALAGAIRNFGETEGRALAERHGYRVYVRQ